MSTRFDALEGVYGLGMGDYRNYIGFGRDSGTPNTHPHQNDTEGHEPRRAHGHIPYNPPPPPSHRYSQNHQGHRQQYHHGTYRSATTGRRGGRGGRTLWTGDRGHGAVRNVKQRVDSAPGINPSGQPWPHGAAGCGTAATQGHRVGHEVGGNPGSASIAQVGVGFTSSLLCALFEGVD